MLRGIANLNNIIKWLRYPIRLIQSIAEFHEKILFF